MAGQRVRGVVDEGAADECLGLLCGEAAVGEVGELLGAHRSDGGAVRALHVVLVAQDGGERLVHDVVTGHQDGLVLEPFAPLQPCMRSIVARRALRASSESTPVMSRFARALAPRTGTE